MLAWPTVLGGLLIVVAWLAEAPRWYRQVGGLLLDGEGGVGMGANLGDAIWWTLIVVVLWALPTGVLGAASGAPGPPPAGPRARRPRAQWAVSWARSSFPTEFLGRRSTKVTEAGAWWAARCRRP